MSSDRRRVYVLPPDLLERLRAFMADEGMTSEAAAVRALLKGELDRRDGKDAKTEIARAIYAARFADAKPRDLHFKTFDEAPPDVQAVWLRCAQAALDLVASMK